MLQEKGSRVPPLNIPQQHKEATRTEMQQTRIARFLSGAGFGMLCFADE